MTTNNSWNSQDPVQVQKGGTGLNTVAQGDLLIASATDTLASLPKNTTATRYLSNTGTNNAPAYAQVNLSNGVTSELPVANGGTGVNTTTAYGVLAGGTTATGAFQNCGAGTAGQVLTSNGAGALPSFQAAGGGGGAMTLLHTITFNNTASSYDITPYVTGYEIYQFHGQLIPYVAGGTAAIGIQLSTDGGATFLGSGYSSWNYYLTTVGNSAATETSNIILQYINASGSIASFTAEMTGYNNAVGVNVHSNGHYSGGGFSGAMLGAGSYYGITANGIKIINQGGGNYISGKLSIYGIAT